MTHQSIDMIINISFISWFSTFCDCFFNLSDMIVSMSSQQLYEFHRRFAFKCSWFQNNETVQRQSTMQTLQQQQQQHQQIIQHQQQQQIEKVFRSIVAFECRRCFVNFANNTKLHQHIRDHHAKKSKIFTFSLFLRRSRLQSLFRWSFLQRFHHEKQLQMHSLFHRRNLLQLLHQYLLRRFHIKIWSITLRDLFSFRSFLQSFFYERLLQISHVLRLHIFVWSITLRDLFSSRRQILHRKSLSQLFHQNHISQCWIFITCFIKNSNLRTVLLWLHICLLLDFSTCFYVKRESFHTSSQ